MEKTLKPYDSVIAAKYLMGIANAQGLILNITKVQKLLYIAYGRFLADHGRPLLNDKPRAWPFGPVFPRTREEVDFGKLIYIDEEPSLQEIRQDKEVTELFEAIVKRYARYYASQLSEWSHMEGSPWEKTTKSPGFKWNDPIPDEYIKDYFSQSHGVQKS